MKKFIFSFLFIFFFFFYPGLVKAESGEKFITIVNPVRISSYTQDPIASLKSEYQVIRENDLSATWLLTSDVLQNPEMVKEIKQMDEGQESGIFLEVTPRFAERAGVDYHETGFWHHATSVFLSGYSQEERKRLIDKVFEDFKAALGYYPTSVGSWWSDSFSLGYMKEKYGITANLTVSDQLSTDGYQVWGQPWMLPYYPSKFSTAVPASNEEVKLGVVNIQWAPRDPLNGYVSSLYSTQDYLVAPKPQEISYFKKLVDLYSSLGQVTVGLEADLDPGVYKKEFSKQMEFIKERKEDGMSVVKMSEFAKRYQEKYPKLISPAFFESEDFLGTDTKAFWYTSKNYRLFYTKDAEGVKIKDLRIYNSEMSEPYYESPNYSFNLSIGIPFVVSEAETGKTWILPQNTEIIPDEDKILIKGGGIKVPATLLRSDLVVIKRSKETVEINFSPDFPNRFGLKIRGFTSEAIHFFKQKKAVFRLLTGRGWNHFKKTVYLIPQGEIYALLYLKSLSAGRVMVYDGECLQCVYHTEFKPPAFANLRKYVKNMAGHPIVYNTSVFNAETRQDAKKELIRARAKYVYLVKFEDYFEKLPFSPGDLGVEKIFSNANAEIWRVQ